MEPFSTKPCLHHFQIVTTWCGLDTKAHELPLITFEGYHRNADSGSPRSVIACVCICTGKTARHVLFIRLAGTYDIIRQCNPMGEFNAVCWNPKNNPLWDCSRNLERVVCLPASSSSFLSLFWWHLCAGHLF